MYHCIKHLLEALDNYAFCHSLLSVIKMLNFQVPKIEHLSACFGVPNSSIL